MKVLTGTIIKGVGAASRTVAGQLPIFERQYDELLGAHPATINVDVGHSIDLKIDFRTLPIPTSPYEMHCFEFIRVMFEYPLGTQTRGWIYQPYGYHWGVLDRKSLLEVLVSTELARVVLGETCRIHILNNGAQSSSTSVHYLRYRGK